MTNAKKLAGVGLGALIAAGLFASPALFAQEQHSPRIKRVAPVPTLPGLGSFTPASADPKLAAILARTGLNSTGFRFTPSEGAGLGNRPVTVAVRSTIARADQNNDRIAAVSPTTALAPIAYNLGVSVGWKRFATSGDLARLDLSGISGSREHMGLGMGTIARKSNSRAVVSVDRPLADQPKMIADIPPYSIDMGGSYKLTRNLDVTAGVRYRTERERLLRIEPDRRDSQSVYVGTAFRF